MGKSGRSYRERARRNDERSDPMLPDFDPEKFDDVMDIYTDIDQMEQGTEYYAYEDEDDDDL